MRVMLKSELPTRMLTFRNSFWTELQDRLVHLDQNQVLVLDAKDHENFNSLGSLYHKLRKMEKNHPGLLVTTKTIKSKTGEMEGTLVMKV